MATLLSITDGGNMMTASTWGVVESTSFQGAAVIATTNTIAVTTQVTGTAFTLASAVTLSGFALQLSGRVASPSGTLNVQLYNNTSSTIITQVTINVADLPNSNGVGANHIDWVYFKFASTITTTAGNSYVIRIQTSVASQISFYYTTATTNMNRALVTTTTQAPVTGDALIVAGNYTSAGVNATTTVIMNDTGTIQTSTIWVSPKGIFRFVTASTATLAATGHVVVGLGGTFNIGTPGSPITSTATLNMTCVSALQYSIFVYGTMTTQGVTKTVASKLASDVAAGATGSTSTSTTGWKSGDILIVPSTTRTYTEFEALTLNADAISTSLTHGAYAAAHGGNSTTRVQADIVNATRNVIIQSTSATFRANIQMFALSTTSFYYTTFKDFGTGVLVTNSGICLNGLTSGLGTFDFQGNFVTATQGLTTSANTAMFTVNDTATTVSNNLFYNLGWSTTVPALSIYGVNDANYIIGCLSSGQVISSTYMGSNNVFASNLNYAYSGFYNNATNNSFYSNQNYGLYFNIGTVVNNTGMNNFKIWRNSSYGIVLASNAINKTTINTFDSLYVFGNGSGNILLFVSKTVGRVLFSNSYFYGGTALVAPYSIVYGATSIIYDGLYFNNCYFGYSDTIGTISAHSTACITSHSGQSTNFNSCYFGGTEIAFNFVGITNTNLQAMSTSTNHGGTAGYNKLWHNNGTLSTDTTIFNTASPSLRMTPVSATYKLPTTNNKIPVKAGQTCTVSVKVRRSVIGDGTAYNGNQPRLMYVFNPILGNLAETICATASAAAGTWQTLTYTTPSVTNDGIAEFYVDCDGTTGWVNVDDWSTTTFNDTRGTDYWGNSSVYIEADYKVPGATYTFFN
jgi:hypothetical protein